MHTRPTRRSSERRTRHGRELQRGREAFGEVTASRALTRAGVLEDARHGVEHDVARLE